MRQPQSPRQAQAAAHKATRACTSAAAASVLRRPLSCCARQSAPCRCACCRRCSCSSPSHTLTGQLCRLPPSNSAKTCSCQARCMVWVQVCRRLLLCQHLLCFACWVSAHMFRHWHNSSASNQVTRMGVSHSSHSRSILVYAMHTSLNTHALTTSVYCRCRWMCRRLLPGLCGWSGAFKLCADEVSAVSPWCCGVVCHAVWSSCFVKVSQPHVCALCAQACALWLLCLNPHCFYLTLLRSLQAGRPHLACCNLHCLGCCCLLHVPRARPCELCAAEDAAGPG